MKRLYDVIVVGAGPAGATLAYQLAKRGVGVLVLEKEKLPRYKCCAGGVTSKAARLLDFDISEVVEDVVHEVSFTFNMGRPYLGRHSQPLIYTVMRDAFDHFLVKRAQQMGAELIDGQRAKRIQVSADWVEIITADSSFRSRLAVGADGTYSMVARELGMRRAIEYLVGMESEIAVPEQELPRWRSRVHIDLGCVPGGYAWVFPKRNHLSIGAGCLVSRAKSLRRTYQKFLNSLGIGSYTIVRSGSHLIPTGAKGGLVWHDRALLLGDAAGLTDPLTGEGIYYAIQSAQLAAPVIEGFLAGRGARLHDYQQVVETTIMSELRIARTLSRDFVRFPRLAFGMLGRSDGVWEAISSLTLGETDYAAIKVRIGGFRGILSRLLRL